MLRILGSARTLCDRITRRETLVAGGLSLFGLGLGDWLRMQHARGADQAGGLPGFGRAKSCILLLLYGSPSQLETCDMKPEAPAEVRGEMRPIASRLPGCDVCEYLPRMATVMDRVTVVRSLTHPYPQHSISFALTGQPEAVGALDMDPSDSRHWPFMGAVASYLNEQTRGGAPRPEVPDNIALPFPISSMRPLFRYAGFQPAFLGSGFAPIWTQFRGKATKHVVRLAQGNNAYWEGKDPYLGIEPDCRFEIAQDDGVRTKDPTVLNQGPRAEADDHPGGVTLDSLASRRTLLEQLDAARRSLDRGLDGAAEQGGLDRNWELAFSLLTSERVRAALDVTREEQRLRESYGMTLFGQATLTARRLVEAGCKFVTVVWDEYGVHNTAWDTHCQHFERMKGELLPGLDMAYAALIEDLEARGLLDETLVLALSEHGRTPRISNAPGGGRDHWSRSYTNWLAGGGVARGAVVGQSDKIASDPVERPLSPKDILATVYHLLGFPPDTLLRDHLGRPLPLVPGGEVVREMLA